MVGSRFEAVIGRVARDRPGMSGHGLEANVTIGLAGLAAVSDYTSLYHVPVSGCTLASKRRPRNLPFGP
jgi:hypothetical protein